MLEITNVQRLAEGSAESDLPVESLTVTHAPAKTVALLIGISMSHVVKSRAATVDWSLRKTFQTREQSGQIETTASIALE